MKQIKNNCVEVLPSLLDKSKTQIIRPAFNIVKKPLAVGIKHNKEGIPTELVNKYYDVMFWKPSKYKVGEKCVLVWNGDMELYHKLTKCKVVHKLGYPIRLGEVEITEVFEIYMAIGKITNELMINGRDAQEIWKKDGFKSGKEFIISSINHEYFNDNYDLSSPKKFYIYRWKWLK